ncbi:YncE family protein [Dactylosporangium cerinum]|uniref:YncE family protein n=1 Tax=Dactylosporangium cerinum TaxID=1434730 RepID=A0ABV9WCS3_9ACTN
MKRRELFGLGGVVLLASCGSAGKPRPVEPGELLAVAVSDGLTVVESGTGRRIVAPAATLATADRRRLVSTVAESGTSRVVTRDARTGDLVTQTTVRGAGRLAAVAPDAGLVALVDGDPDGRLETTIIVAGPAGERHRLKLPGFVQPEAFSSGGTSLFVLDMLPPEHPDHYRVRVLDLAAGQVNALNLPGENAGVKVLVPEGAEEEMRGEGRQAVFDPKRERLFTLYSHQPDHLHVRDLLHPETGARDGKPEVHPFVHTLNVADAWAVCVDLPSSFGTGAVEGLTIAQHNDEVWVADAGKGVLAVINADALAVIHEQAFQPVTGRARLAVSGSAAYLAAGRQVQVFDVGAKTVRATWALPGDARGVAVSGTQVYVGQPDGVHRLDPSTGATTATVSVPGLTAVEGVIG